MRVGVCVCVCVCVRDVHLQLRVQTLARCEHDTRAHTLAGRGEGVLFVSLGVFGVRRSDFLVNPTFFVSDPVVDWLTLVAKDVCHFQQAALGAVA